jgi:hypothetical protein
MFSLQKPVPGAAAANSFLVTFTPCRPRMLKNESASRTIPPGRCAGHFAPLTSNLTAIASVKETKLAQ